MGKNLAAQRFMPDIPKQEWSIEIVPEFEAWLETVGAKVKTEVLEHLVMLSQGGPGLRRPKVGKITSSPIANLKEIIVGTWRILFVFDPDRCGVILVGGNKSKNWTQWYIDNIPVSETRYDAHLKRVAEKKEKIKQAELDATKASKKTRNRRKTAS